MAARHGKRLHKYGTSPCYWWEISLFLWPFSIVMLNYQRVCFPQQEWVVTNHNGNIMGILDDVWILYFFVFFKNGDTIQSIRKPQHKFLGLSHIMFPPKLMVFSIHFLCQTLPFRGTAYFWASQCRWIADQSWDPMKHHRNWGLTCGRFI